MSSLHSWLCRDEEQHPVSSGITPEVVQVYEGVGKILTRFTTGKVPKALKIIPNLKNWEEVCLQPLIYVMMACVWLRLVPVLSLRYLPGSKA